MSHLRMTLVLTGETEIRRPDFLSAAAGDGDDTFGSVEVESGGYGGLDLSIHALDPAVTRALGEALIAEADETERVRAERAGGADYDTDGLTDEERETVEAARDQPAGSVS